MSSTEEIQAEVEKVAEVINDKVNGRLSGDPVPKYQLTGLNHGSIYRSVFSHYPSTYGFKQEVEPLVTELAHLSQHQLRDRVERAAAQGLVVKLKSGSREVSFTSPQAKEIIDQRQRAEEMEQEALEERVERLREKTGLEIAFPKNWWSGLRDVGTTIHLDLDAFEEFVSKVMR